MPFCVHPYYKVLSYLMTILCIKILMSVYKDWLDVIRTVLILLEAIIVLVWMDMNWNQIITLVQVMTTTRIVFITLPSWQDQDTQLCVCSQERYKMQCVIYRKRKVPDFNPLYLWNYSTDFYQIYIFYALHTHYLTNQIWKKSS